ncbi:Poly (ADP-ribose) polymerase [Trebouxia sp. C0010 RCD-2024]
MGHAARSLEWNLRIATVESKRMRLEYHTIKELTSNDQKTTAPDQSPGLKVDKQQLSAYCEAVKRLCAQGMASDQAAEILMQCGGDLDAAELWAGVCSSVGLFSMAGDSSTADRSWAWEDDRGTLRFADNLRDVVRVMQASHTDTLIAVASVIDDLSVAVTSEMRKEVAQLESARQHAQQPRATDLSVPQIQSQLQSSKLKLVAIEEVLNPALWKAYTQQKESMAEPNEQWLFHGSGPENIANISVEGFDMKLANPTGAYGAGIYFACDSSTSQKYTRRDPLKERNQQAAVQPEMLSKAKSMGLQVMLLCSVLVGRVGAGRAQQTAPPAGFDSVGGSRVSVVYNAAQAYPRYIIFLQS